MSNSNPALPISKLTSLSSATIQLILERQRLSRLPPSGSSTPPKPNSLHLQQITRNLSQLRSGILELDAERNGGEAVKLLRKQYERMRNMLGDDIEDIPQLEEPYTESELIPHSSTTAGPSRSPEPVYTPYTDDDEPTGGDAQSIPLLLQTQKDLMDTQDQHLENLSSSLRRQHALSTGINSELSTQAELLEALDVDVENTQERLSRARGMLGRVSKGVKGNMGVCGIGGLILVLLILIIVLKT